MRHPFWILNSALFLICAIIALAILFSSRWQPDYEPVEPTISSKISPRTSSHVNIVKIYENDLFGSYRYQPSEMAVQPIAQTPNPPSPRPVYIPEQPLPQFLEPLDISLKGIIAFINNDSKNNALIVDNKTGTEQAYKVGDFIQDAKVLRIFNTKIILLRSNGQQEVIYLSEQDAKQDPMYAQHANWNTVTTKKNDTTYTILVSEFGRRISNIAQFIDMLDLTTVYKKGIPAGIRIGSAYNAALAQSLGLEKSDILLEVDGLSVIPSTNRTHIYKQIMRKKTGDTIKVSLLRNKAPMAIEYILQQETIKKPAVIQVKEAAQEKRKILEKKNQFAPTLKELLELERTNMMRHGSVKTGPPQSNRVE